MIAFGENPHRTTNAYSPGTVTIPRRFMIGLAGMTAGATVAPPQVVRALPVVRLPKERFVASVFPSPPPGCQPACQALRCRGTNARCSTPSSTAQASI